MKMYLRKEPTTDDWPYTKQKFDVVAYQTVQDAESHKPYARFMWYFHKPRKNCKHVTLNCYDWEAVWLPD